MPQIPHILHIDDSEPDRVLFARAFAKSGVNGALHSVASVAEALMYLNRLGPYADSPRPKLIVLDLSLPHVDGRSLLEQLRTNPRFAPISVVILTGSESYADIKRCRDFGIDDYVIKPNTLQELIELIASLERWLAGSSTRIRATPKSP